MVTIRAYRSKDFAKVCRLMQKTLRASGRRQPKKAVRELVDFFAGKEGVESLKKNFQENTICFVAESRGILAGVVRGRADYLLGLFVADPFQGQGVGQALLRKFENVCRQKRAQYIRTHAFAEATTFYQKNGYKKTTGIRFVEGFRTQPMKKFLTL